MRFVKRTLSAFLALVMVFTMLPLQVWASETQQSANDSVNFSSIVADGAGDDRALEPDGNDVDTYIFKIDDKVVSTQYVKNGEDVYAPEAPAKEGYKFVGWFEGETQFVAGPASNVQGVQHTYTARYQQVYYVFFMDGIGANAAVVHTQEGVPGDAIDTAFTFNAGPDSGVEGWYYNRELTQKVQPDETIQDQNITLYPKVQTGHWLRFDSNGGTPVDSVFMLPGAKTEKPTEPTREGFQFLRWETEAGEEFQFGSELTESVTLKAKWQGDTVNYKVFYWVENADDEDYSLVNTVDKTGIAGEPAVNPGDTLQLPEGYPDKNLANAVHYNAEKTGNEAEKTIAGDGSTIVNVYYDRNEYTLYFYQQGGGRGELICDKEEHTHGSECYQWVGIGLFGYFKLTCKKAEHTHTAACYKQSSDNYAADPITGKYGASLKKMGKHWPTNTEGGNNWSTNNNGKGPYQANIETIPAQNMSFWVPQKPESDDLATHTGYYYVEVLDGEQDGTVVGGKRYKKYDEVSILYYPNGYDSKLTVSEQDRYPIQGFTINEADSAKNGALYDGANFYYTRNRYNLRLVNTANEGPHKIQYEAPLESYLKDPKKPANVGEEFTFQGWYRDENYKVPFDPAVITKMPADNLTLYAKWDAPKFTVTVHLGMGVDSGEPLTITVPYGGKINPNDLPEIELPEGVESYSWATYRDGKYLSFDLDTPLYQDVTIYPYWVSNERFSVTYVLGENLQGEVIDSKRYWGNADADIQGLPKDFEHPEGKVFLGWKSDREGDKSLYQPGDKIQIQNADVTLEAQWGNQAVKTTLTYHPGYEGAKPVEEHWANNEMVKLKTAGELNFTWDGYQFLGWARAANAETPDFAAGKTIRVNNDKPTDNILYAVWKQTAKPGTPITVEVLMDGLQVKAEDYVSVIPVEGTESLTVSGGNPTYTLRYTYEDLNCADFNLSVTVPEGYSVNVTSDEPGPTGSVNLDISGEGASWILDNVPGGATVTVSLITKQFEVTYNTDGNGKVLNQTNDQVDEFEETVDYNQNATGTTAVPNEGYYFVGWKNKDNVFESHTAKWGPTNVTADATYTAVFAQQKEITIKAKDLSKEYDGTAIEANSAQLETIAGELGEGHQLIVTTKTSKDVINVSQKDGKHQIDTYRIVDAAGNDVTNQYSVTTQEGTLTIMPKPVTVTITGNTDETKIYNGSEQSVEGYKVEIPENSGYSKESITFEDKAIAKGTNAGTYYMSLTKDRFDNTDTNYDVTFVVYDGHLTIGPVTDKVVVTIVGHTGTEDYDGNTHTVEGYKVTSITLNGTSTNLYQATDVALADGKEDKASGINAGTYDMGLTADSFQNNNPNFTNVKFVVKDGYLKINPAEVTVTIKGNQETKTYNGSEQSVETGYTATPSNAQYNTEKITFSGKQTVAGTDHGTYPMGLANNQFSNTDTNYSVTFNVQDGSLTINKLPVTVTANSITKDYGASIAVDDLTATKSAADGAVIPADFEDAVTYTLAHDGGETPNVGQYPIYFKIDGQKIENGTKIDKYTNYEVTFVPGTLTINKAGGLTVSGTDVTEKYNGQSHGVAATASVTEGTTIFYKVGDGGWTTTVPQIMDAGTVTVEVKAENPNYTTATGKYTLKVTPRDVTLTSASDSKTYDGTALTNSTVTVGGKGFVVDEGATYEVTGTQTLVGSSDNTFTYTLNEGTLATNYSIRTVLGTLTVEAPEDFDYVQKKFNGQKFAIGGEVTFTITVTNIYDVPATVVLKEQAGMTFVGGKTELTDMLDAGETKTYSVSYKVTEADVEAGQIANKVTWTLTPKDLPEIPGTDEEIIQNPKYKVSYNVSGETPVGYTRPEDAEYPIGKSVEVAAVPNYPGYTFTGWTAPEDITVNEGKFAMPEKNVTLSGVFALAGDTKYKVEHYFAGLDGQYPATPEEIETKTGTTFDMTQAQPIPADQRPGFGVVDGWENEKIQPDGNTVIRIYYQREVYNISWETSGEPAGQEQTFNPANFVYGADISKVKNPEVEQFDGYTWNGWQIQNENMPTLPGTMPAEDIVITGSYTPIDYTVTYALTDDSEKPTNYTAPEDNAKYHIGDNVTVKDVAQVPGYNFEGWYTADGKVTKDMPTFTMPADNVTLYGKFSKRTDLSYTVKYLWNGTNEEVRPSATYNNGTLDETVQVEVPEVENCTPVKRDGIPLTITADATQNVVKVYYYRNVTLTAKSDNSRIYNGESQSLSGYTASVDGLTFNGVEEPTASGINAGEYPLTFANDTKGKTDSEGRYIVTEVENGTLTINKRQVALESESGEQLYNGKALTKPNVKIGDVEFVKGDVTKVKATGTQTLVGESKNTIEIDWSSDAFAKNYAITEDLGTLTVTAPGNLDEYVVKTHEGQDFKVGDKVTFKISVTNIYAVNATVTLEEMAGMTFGNGQTTLEDDLDPGETKTYTATRTLTDADFKNGGVNNRVKVTLTPVDGETGIPGTGTDEVELEEKPDMSVVKTVLNPKESYRVGDTIQYQITVTNTGNVTLHDLELTDVMNADGKVTFPAGTDLTRKTLNVGDRWTVTCSYVVRAADEGKEISNKATVIAHDPETKDPEKEAGDTTDGEQVQNRYSLTIHYRNGAGNAVAGSYSARYHVGDSFKIDSPIVAGYYDPQIRSIRSGANGMPAQDLEYVVIYTAIPVPAPDPGPGPAPNPGPGPGPAPNPGPDDGDDDDDTPPVPNPEQEQPPQPQDFEIDPDDYTLTELEDNETPLANLDLDGHTCCILHLLLMLAAMVVLGFYTKSRKKHQARIFELKRILAAEEDHPDDPQQP